MWDKLIDASVPKLLTERVLIALLFLALSADNYLLATHHGNIGQVSQAITSFNTKDTLYFIVVLALSWLFILPFIKTVVTLIFIFRMEGKITDSLGFMTDKQLLVKAVEDDNSVAYQHLENHIKHLKTRQVINELYFYVLITSAVNVYYENSFMRDLWSRYPYIAFPLSLVIIYLGFAVGIVDNIHAKDGMTDVPLKKVEKDSYILPKM